MAALTARLPLSRPGGSPVRKAPPRASTSAGARSPARSGGPVCGGPVSGGRLGGGAAGKGRAPPPPSSPRGGAPQGAGGLESRRLQGSQLLGFERSGHVAVRGLFAPEELQLAVAAAAGAVRGRELDSLRHRIRVLCPGVDPMSVTTVDEAEAVLGGEAATDDVSFLQFFNLHRTLPAVRELVLSDRLAGAAAQLLGTPRVRLYQDCLFVKKPSHGATNWHSDLRMAPLDTNDFLTVWIPLRPVRGGGDSGLLFASKSHRDFALPFWHDMGGMDLETRGYVVEGAGAMALGDVTFHHGWTLHFAPDHDPGVPTRAALAACYFRDGARTLDTGAPSLRSQVHSEDYESYKDWVKDIKPGGMAKHPLLVRLRGLRA